MRTQHKTSLSKHLRLVSDSLHPRLQQQLCGLERMTAQLSCDQLGQFKRNTRAISFPVRDPILEELSWIRNTCENLHVMKLQREAVVGVCTLEGYACVDYSMENCQIFEKYRDLYHHIL